MAINPLPAADPIAQAHSDQLKQHIINTIKQQGAIPFSDFMQLALYAPGLGYYSAGAQKFGKAGDFVTAPEISPLFSRCLARQCRQIIHEINDADILEFGAGSGMMALELLRELQRLQSLPKHYYILEISADLRERQQQLFQTKAPELLSIVQWLNHLPTEPINGVILANEVLDAMPAHKFIWQADKPREYYVSTDGQQLQWFIDKPSTYQLTEKIKQLNIAFSDQYQSEINLLLPAWIASISATLASGVCLIIDYGFPQAEYYHPDRDCGTLMCHYRHRAHTDPLIHPGIQDITCHVDFTAIAEAALDHQLHVSGYTHQAAFLLNCGLIDALQSTTDEFEHLKLSQQIKRLTLPGEMGEAFKAIALTKDYSIPLLGFQQMDLRHKL